MATRRQQPPGAGGYTNTPCSLYLCQGRKQIPQHFPIFFRALSACFISLLMVSRPSSIWSSCSKNMNSVKLKIQTVEITIMTHSRERGGREVAFSFFGVVYVDLVNNISADTNDHCTLTDPFTSMKFMVRYDVSEIWRPCIFCYVFHSLFSFASNWSNTSKTQLIIQSTKKNVIHFFWQRLPKALTLDLDRLVTTRQTQQVTHRDCDQPLWKLKHFNIISNFTINTAKSSILPKYQDKNIFMGLEMTYLYRIYKIYRERQGEQKDTFFETSLVWEIVQRIHIQHI